MCLTRESACMFSKVFIKHDIVCFEQANLIAPPTLKKFKMGPEIPSHSLEV